jgi:AraC-like DNA-binding protein
MKKNKQFKRHVMSAIGTIKDILDNNQVQGDTTIEMSRQFGVSRNVLQSAFKQEYGISIREYKLQQRMELSRSLLEQGKDAKVVSLEVHYATQSGFTSAFKKYYGITPSASVNGEAHVLI